MKALISVSLFCVAQLVTPLALAADTAKNRAPAHADGNWKEVPSPKWEMRDASLPASISLSEVGIFPALSSGALPTPSVLAGSAASKALLAPALVANKDVGLNSFLAYLNLPQASYAFPSQPDGAASAAMRTKTELAGKFEAAKSIAEPASEVLMLGALAALAIAVRRRMPNERF